MGSDKIYVCTGAVLHCTQGTSNSSLSAMPKCVSLCNEDQANITDHISMVNVKPFGRCRSLTYPPTASATAAHYGHLTPMPCVPGTMTNWTAVDPDSQMGGQPALLDTAKLRCIYGGEITIVNPGQQLEKTGAEKIEIVVREAIIDSYFWEDGEGNECDMATIDGIGCHSLCLQTSLTEGDQLIVNIGHRGYRTVVGAKGVAKVENVDVSEIDWNIPMRSQGKTAASSNDKNKKSSTPVKAKPADTGTVNKVMVPIKADSGWGDPIANPSIRRNCASNLYGAVRRDSKGNPRNHQGFDYYAPTGTNVMSVGDGVVYNVQYGHYAYGNNVIIRHTRGGGYVYSFYAHLKDITPGVEKGKVIKKGDVIAHAGTTGNAQGMTGPDQHLHFEARTSPAHQMGLGGKESPNNIVATKFRSADTKAVNQSQVTVVKE